MRVITDSWVIAVLKHAGFFVIVAGVLFAIGELVKPFDDQFLYSAFHAALQRGEIRSVQIGTKFIYGTRVVPSATVAGAFSAEPPPPALLPFTTVRVAAPLLDTSPRSSRGALSGADFVEMFAGTGASRVRDLFQQAQEQTPAIVFIDELDAVGKKRGASPVQQNDEREQTLNQLLTELDGFDTRDGVIVLAATNRPEILDPALRRAFRSPSRGGSA